MRATVKHCPSVMIWGCFSHKGVGSLRILEPNQSMNSAWYVSILEKEVCDTLKMHFGGVHRGFFQDDGAPCHRSKVVIAKCQQLGIRVLEWPGQSPDCNPIENLWAYLKQRVRLRNPLTVSALKDAVRTVWNSEIPLHYCQALTASMPFRLKNVIRRRGFPTKYWSCCYSDCSDPLCSLCAFW